MRVITGPEKKTRVMSEKERLVTAFHEMGHAIVGHLSKYRPRPQGLDHQPRPGARLHDLAAHEDKFLTSRAELTDTMAMTLGGRAAEEIVFGEITTGASNDLEKVTETAKQMVMRFGMSERLGPRVFGHDRSQPFLGREFSSEPDYSDEIAREIDDEIRRHRRVRPPDRQRPPDRAPQGPRPDLEHPARARDDRRRAVRGPARRQARERDLRRRRGGAEGGRAGAGAGAAATRGREAVTAAKARVRRRRRLLAKPAWVTKSASITI